MTVEKLYSWKVPECREDREQRWTDTRNKLSVMWEGKCSFSYEMSLSLKSESHPNKICSSARLSLLEALENVLTSLLCSDQRAVAMQNKLIVTVQNHQTHSHASLPLPALPKIFLSLLDILYVPNSNWPKKVKVEEKLATLIVYLEGNEFMNKNLFA